MLIKMLMSGEMPLAEAATPKASPNGITNAAMGVISRQRRHTPLAVKRGRPSWFIFGTFSDIWRHLRRGLPTGQSTGAGSRQRRLLAPSRLGPSRSEGGFRMDCVAKLSLRRLANRDSVGLR